MLFSSHYWSWVVMLLGCFIVLIGFVSYRIRRSYASVFFSQASNFSISRWRKRMVIFFEILSVLFLASALLGPTMWFFYETKRSPVMHNIVFVVDVSRSMLVPDFASGSSFLSRLDASKEMIRQTLRAYDATSLVQFSLIAFSTKYRLVAPPTTSRDTIARMLSSLHPRVTGAAGTDLAVIGDIISTDNDFPESTLFIIFTDGGEDMSPTIRQGFLGNVLVVPIGSDSGGLVPQDNSLFPIPSMSPDSWDRSQISRRNDRAIWVLSRSIGAEVISENDALIPQIIGHIPNAVPEGKKGDDATPTFVLLSFLCFLFSFIPTKIVWSRGL